MSGYVNGQSAASECYQGKHGDGRLNPFKSDFVSGFEMTPEEKQDLLNFLFSLTDNEFITDPRFSNPFVSELSE